LLLRRTAIWIVVLTMAAVALGVEAVRGERMQKGNLIVSVSGKITPHDLPRTGAAPIMLHLSSDFSTADGSRLPQLRRIEIAIGQRGSLLSGGLPFCRAARIRATTVGEAVEACGSSLVGHGRIAADVVIPGQAPFSFSGRLLAFNGRLADGRRAILGDVHSKAPPLSFVMPFVIQPPSGSGGTVITARLPRSAGSWTHLRHFDLTLGRRFRYRGRIRSVMTGSCSVPRGFTGIVFPLAEATYTFAGGQRVSATIRRSCSVRE
jgi:hypothetical protein